MKKLFASMFGLSLLALFLLSGESRTIGVDDSGLHLLADCGKDHGDKKDDDKETRLLADCGKDHGDKKDDDKETRLLADCGKDHGDKKDDKEDSLV